MSMIRSCQTRSGDGGWHSYADITALNEPAEDGDLRWLPMGRVAGDFPPYPTLAELGRYIAQPLFDHRNVAPWREWKNMTSRMEGPPRPDSPTSIVVSDNPT